MTVPREEWHLEMSHVGRRVLVFDRLDSTNTFALGQADDLANDGLVVLADEQSAGRGQHGRTWTCPGGGGVLMSILIFPLLSLRRPAILTAWAAVSVCELIRSTTGLEASIKWPNDILIDGCKVCGILIEQTRGAVVGIGLNVNQPREHFAAQGLTQGASLAMFTQRQDSCRDVARHLIGTLDGAYGSLCRGDLATLETQWRERLALVGKEVQAETTTESFRGRLRSLSFGGLEVELPDGTLRTLMPEVVRHVF